MKAFNMKKQGSKNLFVRIVKDKETVRDENDQPMEKVGGPIGGINILPRNIGEEDEFVPFRLDDGILVESLSQMKSAYNQMYGIQDVKAVVDQKAVADQKPVEALPIEAKRRGRPKKENIEGEATDAA